MLQAKLLIPSFVQLTGLQAVLVRVLCGLTQENIEVSLPAHPILEAPRGQLFSPN
jgi:hypothetical protein